MKNILSRLIMLGMILSVSAQAAGEKPAKAEKEAGLRQSEPAVAVPLLSADAKNCWIRPTSA